MRKDNVMVLPRFRWRLEFFQNISKTVEALLDIDLVIAYFHARFRWPPWLLYKTFGIKTRNRPNSPWS
jgi:hypothetical protein